MWFATVADGVVTENDHDSSGEISLIKQQASLPPADVRRFLLKHFGTWHKPIGGLIRATEAGDITREDAKAMSRRGLKAVAAAGSASRQSIEGLVLVGDAAHTVRV